MTGHVLASAVLLLTGASASATPLPPPDTIAVPNINVALGDRDLRDGDKYFYFHRDGTDFATAFADINQCDALSRNLLPGTGNAMYGGLAIGIAVGSIVAANQHNVRRTNLRRCMFFKGYQRYAVPKAIWQQIAFDESGKGIGDDERQSFLLKQARIASGPLPNSQELGE